MQISINNPTTLAVRLTWLSAIIPWSISVFSPGAIVAVYVRFLPIRVLSILGVSSSWADPYLWVWEAPAFVAGGHIVSAGYAWVAASATFLLPLTLSIAAAISAEHLQRWGIDIVPTLGWLLVFSGTLFTIAVFLFWKYQDGLTTPVGVLFQLAAGLMLVKIDQK
jgi:hypothetical protein